MDEARRDEDSGLLKATVQYSTVLSYSRRWFEKGLITWTAKYCSRFDQGQGPLFSGVVLDVRTT